AKRGERGVPRDRAPRCRFRDMVVTPLTFHPPHGTVEIRASVSVASNRSWAGHGSHVAPSAGWLGLPVRAKAPRVFIMCPESASRRGRLPLLLLALANTDGPKLPKRNGRSKAWA